MTSRADQPEGFHTADTTRRLANLLRMGKVVELDEAKARVKVKLGDDMTTTWLPWLTHRAGPDRDWHAPEPGEQVMVLSPSGDMRQGVVMPSVYQNSSQAPANLKTTHRLQYADGAFIQYDRLAHKYAIDVPSAGEIKLHIGGSTITMIDGKITLASNGASIELSSAGVKVVGSRIDLN